ncbi:MAG: transglycosylase SLT domain-containing protein [Betaproteobacteria bacterium]|nr:transglycosylase SLT domain-containing protein [Betaproteobacteria bacterium]MDE2003022.1 transglycosylase SLT domain-containing protein [Betaproteobacteria bacterium]MDE2210952.1 transglycosylase SLT domain-containing protein [Betaproteobacteria bacterium]MDE2359513.1 transglycosylase SLT domain-containing protein [Betaproteobacteria bacterium]
MHRATSRLCARTAALTLVLAAALGAPLPARAGAQVEEQLSASVVMGLQRSIADNPPSRNYENEPEVRAWIADMSPRLAKRLPDPGERHDLLAAVSYEASRAGLDPQLVLGLIHHESNFRKYAISSAGARGYMQVMPFWVRQIGAPDQNLFQMRTNLRYGCTILRYYLDTEKGNLFRALGRYNGSLGQADYPMAVIAAERLYQPSTTVAAVRTAAATPSN